MGKEKTSKLKQSTLLQLYARAAAPSRDYYGLTIAESCICLNIWQITHGPHSFPKQKFCEITDFIYDKYLQEEIKNAFGENVIDYIRNLSNNNRKLENIPRRPFLKIMQYLKVNDILRLARTNKIFYELCQMEEVWLVIFQKILHRQPSMEEKRMAFEYCWKETLRRRLAYIKQAIGVKKKVSAPARQTISVNQKKSVTNKSVVSKKGLIKTK